MIKNIILDVGGILFDDSRQNIERVLNKNCDSFFKKAYGNTFTNCLLGEMIVQEHVDLLKDDENYEDIKFLLKRENLCKSYPLIEKNFNYVKELKKKGYKLYLLTNITEDSFNYMNETINIDKIFDGGIYSYQEHLMKPNYDIYELLINKFKLKKDETIFFDDKEKNVVAANEIGIKAVEFKSVSDIENNLE